MTNYKKIKNMSVKEMADFIDRNDCCDCCAYRVDGCRALIDCPEGIKKWLESEAEDENNTH